MNRGRAAHLPHLPDIDTMRLSRSRPRDAQPCTNVQIARYTYEPLRALSQQTGIPVKELFAEAVALLLLEHDEPIPAKLRAKVRLHEHDRR